MSHLWWSAWDLLHALVCLVLWPLRWTKFGQKRAAFEHKRDATFFHADWAFEVSSEGEYEQVRPWINTLLAEGQLLEIVFASESVEKGMLALQGSYPQQVRLMRLPLLTYRFGAIENFLTARRLVLCRYDFFPSLMRRAARSDVRSGVVWATFKNRRQRLAFPWWRQWYRFFYGAFDWIIPATTEDEALFRLVHANVFTSVDFRVGQIHQRLLNRSEVLAQKFPQWSEFQQILGRYPRERRLIIGSAWPSDLELLRSDRVRELIERREIIVLVVPHQLSDDWGARLRELSLSVSEVSPHHPLPQAQAQVWLINLKGVLCELYGEAGKVFVGGGFERSVHSVMEPYVAGASIWCGPKVHRSTEVELVQSVEPTKLQVLTDWSGVADKLFPGDDAQGPDLSRQWSENQERLAREAIEQLKD